MTSASPARGRKATSRRRRRSSRALAEWAGAVELGVGSHPRLALFLALFVPFTVFARFVGRFHPINAMTMFAAPVKEASHITVRMPSGELRDVNWFTRWSCDAPISFAENGRLNGSHEIHRNYLLANMGTPLSGLSVEIVRRNYHVAAPGAAVEIEDSTLYHCRADLKDAPTLW